MAAVLSFLRNLYDLDTLDTRFTNPATVPYKTIVDARHDNRDAKSSKERAASWNSTGQPSKWKTPELYLYLFYIGAILPAMFYIPYQASRSDHPAYHKFERLLSPGWIPGRMIDTSDSQYHTFRTNLPYMMTLLVVHPIMRRVYAAIFHRKKANDLTTTTPAEDAQRRLDQRAGYDFKFAIKFLIVLHGFSAAKVLLILFLNYKIATALPRKYVPAATWIFNIGLLFANELCQGYKMERIAAFLAGVSGKAILDADVGLVAWGKWLDSFGGLMGRWEILFNITVLRLISFNLDYYWSSDRSQQDILEKKQLDPAALSERERVSIPAQPRDYSLRNYVAYVIYAPLYLTGPIITFNDYIAQAKYKSATIETSRTIRYGIRFLVTLLVMEAVLHFDYVQAISNANPNWADYTAAQLSVLGYFQLHLIWLKLLLPWRLFRLWALVDGIDPPENMIRCVSDNYSTLSFWRSWHRSFYRWSLRYIYMPLGGASFKGWAGAARSIVTYMLVFTFVALWHDIQLRLLIWGWLVVFFMMPEMMAGALFPKRKWESRPTAFRMISCVGAVINILMMMSANLIGYAVGVDGMKQIINGITRDHSGATFCAAALIALFCGAQIMFEIRETEKRRGINLKC
ncbi:putative glycerol: H+ symporter [Microdochium trichocladiopsis]|uniref:Glycerol: H+ symporter n=1 Tax=Microdochium trichocladiopsis TaxID=1682393 RepID=A0A9P8Y762_9PEZI|nr:putative glycerol: H+ symporter [Microdochium trichocladiopsis]KAH7029638.1 putative glycerol: H+ symporter [Microdochium trichocladiopsis]